MKLTDEQKRIAIACHMGWKNISNSTNYVDRPDGTRKFFNPCEHPCEHSWEEFVPDYLEDLNAIHEAVMSQPKDFLIGFAKNLCSVTGWGINLNGCVTYIIHATARQRAESFGLTLNLWKNES